MCFLVAHKEFVGMDIRKEKLVLDFCGYIIMKISKRHIAKTITWRLIGTLDTFLLSWLITGDFKTGLKIGSVELLSKMLLYYFHERIWFKSAIKESNKRHIYKTFSWRAIGTLDTILLGWLITGNPLIGLKIGGARNCV